MEVPVQPPVQQSVTPVQQPPVQSSSQSKKSLFFAITLIVLVVIFGVVVYLMRGPSSYTGQTSVNPSTAQTNISPSAMEVGAKMGTGSGLPTGTSDSQLEQDTQSIEASLESAGTGLVEVEQGMSDQSVDLSE